MSVSFRWDLVKDAGSRFAHGTSSDIETLKLLAPSGELSAHDVKTLRVMHAATGLKDSLWLDIADCLERLQGDNYEKNVAIEIWTEF